MFETTEKNLQNIVQKGNSIFINEEIFELFLAGYHAYMQITNGVQWFKDRGQWADNSIEPTPGMIIFFDWDSPNGSSGPQDGQSDHVGIVEKCENGIVYTIEGNSGDSCRQRQYSVGYYEILGYGIPAY